MANQPDLVAIIGQDNCLIARDPESLRDGVDGH
jgi:hypothetical protein